MKKMYNIFYPQVIMKKLFTITILILFLTSCWKTEEVVTQVQKSDFFVATTLGEDFSGVTSFEKTWQASSSQDIELSANANGRVNFVGVKAGDSVQVWQVIASLEDNIGSYGINLQRSSISVERAQINYESSKITLDKQVFDAQINLDKLQRNLEALKKDSDQNIIQAQDALDNSQYDGLDSTSALQLQQLDNNIEKAKLDYQIKLTADSEQIDSYAATLRKDFNSLQIFLDDIIEFSDEILWVTELNRTENDDYEMFLGAEDVNQKLLSESTLRQAINYRQNQTFTDTDTLLRSGELSQEQILSTIEYINDGYEISQDVLSNLEQTLYNTTPSVWEISETQIDTFNSTINGYQSQLQATYGAFISFGSWVKSFLRTYKENQASILKSIELQEKEREVQFKTLVSGEVSAETSFERTIISIEDNLKNLEDQVKTAQNDLENAKKNRDISLKSLRNAIDDAKVGYSSAAKEYAKLTIRSPINGTISDVFIDKGQEVFSGTSLFKIVSDDTPEVEVSFSAEEKKLLKAWQEVFVVLGETKIPGSIYAISDVADENLNYKSTIVFESGTNIIGNLVVVEVPIQTNKMLVPLNIITTQGDNIGTLKTLSGSIFEDVRVRMWEVFGEYVEIVSCAQNCETLKVITNDISNFDENKFVIVEK